MIHADKGLFWESSNFGILRTLYILATPLLIYAVIHSRNLHIICIHAENQTAFNVNVMANGNNSPACELSAYIPMISEHDRRLSKFPFLLSLQDYIIILSTCLGRKRKKNKISTPFRRLNESERASFGPDYYITKPAVPGTIL